jgi:hypothetical protein
MGKWREEMRDRRAEIGEENGRWERGNGDEKENRGVG